MDVEGDLIPSGRIALRREMLDGRPWLSYPTRVAVHDYEVTGLYLAHRTPLIFGDGPFSWGPHCWSSFEPYWMSEGVLQLQRPGEYYSLWRRTEEGAFAHWYVNFQRPLKVSSEGFDSLDLDLDLIIRPDGSYEWKDEEKFQRRVDDGHISAAEAEAVRRSGDDVLKQLADGRPWWEAWRDWEPPQDWVCG
ncbi:DUF402 domain-containing protein [Salininema proteolyticum]|uniref:DUF402 domain-containing protein n=1 Tax=Salininema proteolyticum TaxID=1607685 RepID=A0ABV8TWI1_9ACTN